MNIEERKIIIFRLIAAFLLLVPIAIQSLAMYQVFAIKPDEIVLLVISICAVAAFNLFEIILILRGWKKQSHLYDIAFNKNGTLNNVPVFAVAIGAAFGVGLTILSTIVYFYREEMHIKCSMLVILSIGSYLLINCIVYFIFLIFYKKREINLRDFIK